MDNNEEKNDETTKSLIAGAAYALFFVLAFLSVRNHKMDTLIWNVDSAKHRPALKDNGAASPLPYLLLNRFKGRLGNKMFQYCSTLGIANASGMQPILSLRTKGAREFQSIFELTPGHVTDGVFLRKWTYIKENRSIGFMESLMHKRSKDTKIAGYLLYHQYFDHMEPLVRKEMTFRKNIRDRAVTMLKKTLHNIVKHRGRTYKDVTYIGIHARRTDLATYKSMQDGVASPNKIYFMKAMEYFKSKFPNTVFIISSDDRRWANSNIRRRRTDAAIVAGKNIPAVDMAVLGMCNHSIMSIGTFGWWSSWLAGGETVYYSKNPIPGSSRSKRFFAKDFYLPQWVAIP